MAANNAKSRKRTVKASGATTRASGATVDAKPTDAGKATAKAIKCLADRAELRLWVEEGLPSSTANGAVLQPEDVESLIDVGS